MILLLVILLVILLLVIPHELGHFFAAKWFRVRVEEFGIGIPPRLWGKKIGETFYSLNLLPLGAFVRLFGEEGDSEDPRSFSGQKIWKKSVVVGAGVFANIFIGFLIFSFLAWYGEPQIGAEISSIAQGSPADTAGLEPGDIIIGIDAKNDAPPDIPTVLQYIDMHRGQGASFFIDRKGERLYIEATPRSSPPPGEGALGIAIADHDFGLKRVPWYRAPIDGFSTTLKIFWLTLKGLAVFFGDLFTKAKLSGEVIGPVGIAKVATDIFRTS
ncbi:MAG: site-2 protease family protein, partial [Candidatus Ryanbacteria bacterium]|nr:site-2 protease family protein [Candidatus Ryanbacteria bacterium]